MDLNLIAYSLLSLLIAALAIAFARFFFGSKKELRRQAEIIKQLQQNQPNNLQLVETTLNPHLFKNILNSIQSHAYQTYFALDKLANVLDYILYDSRQEFVSPKDEIQFSQALIEINKIKLSPLFELQVKIKIDEQDLSYVQKVMAPLISIDLIENAFKHADVQSQDSFIKIVIALEDGIFSMTVANKVSERPPLSKTKSGIGSKTLDQRLKAIYGSHYSLYKETENDQYIAQLKIHLRDFQTQVHSS